MGQQGPSGGTGGQPYNDNNTTSSLRQLIVHHGDYIDKIELHYDDGTIFNHGGNGGDHVDAFVLVEGDYLVGIEGLTGTHNGDDGVYVVTLCFVTQKGAKSPTYGHEDGDWANWPTLSNYSYTAPEGEVITAFWGRCNKFIDAIGIYTAPALRLGRRSLIAQLGPSGGDGGNPYTDNYTNSLIRQIVVHHGAYVDRIELHYDDGTVIYHGGGGGDHIDIFAINPGDVLQGIAGKVGAQVDDGGPYVAAISFITRAGVQSPMWGCEDFGNLWTPWPLQEFQYAAPSSEVVTAIFGRCNKYIDSIGIYTAPQPNRHS
jgi:hypothetical protein